VHGTEASDTGHKGVKKICENNYCPGKTFRFNILSVNDAPRVKGDSVEHESSYKWH